MEQLWVFWECRGVISNINIGILAMQVDAHTCMLWEYMRCVPKPMRMISPSKIILKKRICSDAVILLTGAGSLYDRSCWNPRLSPKLPHNQWFVILYIVMVEVTLRIVMLEVTAHCYAVGDSAHYVGGDSVHCYVGGDSVHCYGGGSMFLHRSQFLVFWISSVCVIPPIPPSYTS